jgi:hypothetical protein
VTKLKIGNCAPEWSFTARYREPTYRDFSDVKSSRILTSVLCRISECSMHLLHANRSSLPLKDCLQYCSTYSRSLISTNHIARPPAIPVLSRTSTPVVPPCSSRMTFFSRIQRYYIEPYIYNVAAQLGVDLAHHIPTNERHQSISSPQRWMLQTLLAAYQEGNCMCPGCRTGKW